MDSVTNLKILKSKLEDSLLLVHAAFEESQRQEVRDEVIAAIAGLQNYTMDTINTISYYIHTEIRK